jgi:hypothetical protein
MQTFSKRLEAARRTGDLRVSDLQAWFERPYHTVLGWLQGAEPHDHRAEVYRRLDCLEQAVKKRKGLPIPYALNHRQRRAHVQGVQRAVNDRLPRARAAR